MTPSRTRRRIASLALAALLGITLTLTFAATVSAQVISNPRIAEFDPSPDHSAVLDGGEPAVLRYDLGMYLVGALEPFTTVDMGKPSPDADGKIRYDFSSAVTGLSLPGGNYEARVRAVGPEGAALSDPSNPFTFTTGSPCTITLSARSARVPASGGAYTIDVSTDAGCNWTVTTALSWVTLWSAGGSGSGTAPFDVKANASSSSRTGTITIGGQTLTLTQDGAPPPLTTPTVSWATPAAITQGTALGAAQLNATASVPGTFVYTPPAGTVLSAGTHTLGATFTPTDTTRYTTATASTTLVVTVPRTTCSYSVSPTSASVPAAGGTGNVSVITDAGCAWTMVSNQSWLVPAVTSGSGTATSAFTVKPNGGASSRKATLTIGPWAVVVTQSGKPRKGK
jgi:hypothetical protein